MFYTGRMIQVYTAADGRGDVRGFRLVLPRDKQVRLAQRVSRLAERLGCRVPGCEREGLAVVLVDSETDAVLCPRHELVALDGQRVEGRPMFATATW